MKSLWSRSAPRQKLSTAVLSVAILCLVFHQPAQAGTTVIGRINPPGLSTAGVSGITFDTNSNPLVVDGFGSTIWRIDLSDASVIASYPLPDPSTIRSLEFDVFSHHLFVTRRPQGPDLLSIVNPLRGTLTDLGTLGTFNFVDLAINPVTGYMWMVNDCGNETCSQIGGGQLWSVQKQSGAAAVVQDYGFGRGQFTGFAISATGKFYVSTSFNGFSSIYQIDPASNNATFITDTNLGQNDLLIDMAFDPATGRLYAIEERRSVTPREWYLDEVTGLPSE